MFRIILFLVILFSSFAAHAQIKDKGFKDWTVYLTDIDGKKVCYITSFPKSKSGTFLKRDDPYFMVTYIGDEISEVSTSSGYKYKEGSKVEVKFGTKKLNMFTNGELAWAENRAFDKEFVLAMKKKDEFYVKGFSAKGTYSVDKYSLNGFSAAYERMKASCKSE